MVGDCEGREEVGGSDFMPLEGKPSGVAADDPKAVFGLSEMVHVGPLGGGSHCRVVDGRCVGGGLARLG